MSDIIGQSFGPNLLIMQILRLYPSQRYTRLHQLQACIMYVFFIILVPTLTIYNYIIQENFDILQFNYTATFLAETVSWIAKLLPFITNANRMKKCITYFGTRYFEEMLQRYTSAKIMKECISVCRRNSTVFLYGVICGMTSFITKPLFWKGYQLPLDMWLPFDATSGPGIYYTTYSFLAIAISYCAFAGTLIDPLIGGLACHATGQLKVLKVNLQHLKEYTETEVKQSDETSDQIMYEKIRQCIDHHNAILIFVKEFENCFSLVVLSQFTGSMVAICFCCLQLSMVDLVSMSALSSTIYIFIILGQFFFYCYYGSRLFEENNSLTNGIYMGQWYEYNIKLKKALIILMERSKVPMLITAGKILPLNLETFTLVI
nr:PREDICTED: odorant receptor 94b-like [Tribolium castaneum]|eukprot:XP_015839876.1 PREDICTED: odorant receptor 94b-like [Tribolium castaneum]